MPDHPQSTVTSPSSVFRESFLRWIELPAAHRAVREFGELFNDLSGEGHRAIMLPREGKVSGTYFQHVAWALLLDLEAIRAELAGLAEQVGEGESLEDNRLALSMADLRPRIEEVGAILRVAYERATAPQAPPDLPLFKSAPGARPIACQDVPRGLHGEDGEGGGGA